MNKTARSVETDHRMQKEAELAMNRRKFINMDRRKFLTVSMITTVGAAIYRAAGAVRETFRGLPGSASQKLFPTDLPDLEWSEFSAAGFSKPACGLIHRTSRPSCCGVPLGGISTGCLDLEVSGALGFNTVFNGFPRERQLLRPFMGLAISGRTWVLASEQIVKGGTLEGCAEPRRPVEHRMITIPPADSLNQVGWAREIHYWGHYPMVDMEYEMDAPISVGLRAWAPFVPGDAVVSNTPGAVFEVHLRNTSTAAQQGTLAFCFPGPTQEEAQISSGSPRRKIKVEGVGSYWWGPAAEGAIASRRQPIQADGFSGISVTAETGVGYCLGVIGKERLRLGGGFKLRDPDGWGWTDRPGWADIRSGLPQASEHDFGASLAVDFALAPGEEKTVRIVLAWYAPLWHGKGKNCYTQMYATRFKNAVEVVRLLAREHESLLRRILAWQQAIYTAEELPVWLRETLVNNLALIAEDSYWAAAKEPLEWAAPAGLFGMNESPRSSPQIECTPCSWYGNLPIVYFFPELARSTLRGYQQYQGADGAAPFIWGPESDMATPYWQWQKTLNGVCFVDMADRLWLRTGDDEVLRELYAAVKKSTTYTMNLRPGPEGVISMPTGNVGQTWWERGDWFGMCSHLGGMRLSNLKIGERMAERMGDSEFAQQCREWFKQGSIAMEEKMWTGQYYLLCSEPETGRKSDVIMANQLDGDWANYFHGLPSVFRPDRAKKALATIKQNCLVENGAVSFANPDGSPQLKSYGIFGPEILILGMTYLYAGDRDTGLETIRRLLDNLVCKQRHSWDLPNMIHADTGQRVFGTDYYQNMILWAMPAAIAGTDLRGPCAQGGLADRILKAGRVTPERP